MANKDHQEYMSYFKDITTLTTIDIPNQLNSIKGKELKNKLNGYENIQYKEKAGFYYADIEDGGINTGSAAGIRGVPTVIITTINTSLGSMSTSFNALSTGVTKDMTEALTKVDEKVGNFNQQVQLLNQSQEGITKILAGVKKYGTLAEYSLDALIKDLLPASQFMTNVKMKEDTSENVEFAIKLQGDILVPVDSHFPVEKFKASSPLARFYAQNNQELPSIFKQIKRKT